MSPTRGAASKLGVKRLESNWDGQSRGCGEAEVGGAVYGKAVNGGMEGGRGGDVGCRAAQKL